VYHAFFQRQFPDLKVDVFLASAGLLPGTAAELERIRQALDPALAAADRRVLDEIAAALVYDWCFDLFTPQERT
jgi:hypothetical protein